MATIDNLEIIAEVDVSDALSSLEALSEKLESVADDIRTLDARGTEGIDIRTNVDGIGDDLAEQSAQIEAFEAANSIDLDSDVHNLGLAERAFEFGGAGGADPMRDLVDMSSISATAAASSATSRRGGLVGRIGDMADKIGDILPDMDDFDLRMSDLHNALARAVPLLLVFIGVIPTAAAALLTLASAAVTAATAMLSIGGLALLGAAGAGQGMPSGEAITEQLKRIVEGVFEAVAPLAERLAPLFDDAVTGIERFFEALVAEQDALTTLVDDLRDFGEFVTEFVPSMARTLSGVTEAMGPIFGLMGDFLDENFQSVMRELVQTTLDAAPALGALAAQLGQMLLTLAEVGIGFAAVATSIFAVLNAVGGLLSLLPITSQQLGIVVGGLLTLVSAMLLARAATAAFAFVSGARLVAALQGHIFNMIMATSATMSFATASALAAVSAIALLSVLGGIGIVLAGIGLGAASNQFLNLKSDIDATRQSLEEFDRVANGVDGPDFNPYAPDPTAATDSAANVVGGGTTTNITVKSGGDPNRDRSNLDKAAWRANRTNR